MQHGKRSLDLLGLTERAAGTTAREAYAMAVAAVAVAAATVVAVVMERGRWWEGPVIDYDAVK